MSLENAVGQPSYNTAGFVPQYWSRVWNAKYYKQAKLTRMLQSKYFNELKNAGDKVTIPTIPTVAVGSFTTGGSLNFQVPTSTPVELTLSRQAAWAFAVFDQSENRSHLDLAAAFKGDAVKQIDIYVETQALADLVTQADATNKGATAGAVSGAYNLGTAANPIKLETTNVIEVTQSLTSCLNENNITGDKHFILPEVLRGVVLRSELKAANVAGDNVSQLRSGEILRVDGADFNTTNCYNQLLHPETGAPLLPGITCTNSNGDVVQATGADALHPSPILCFTNAFGAYGGVLSKIEDTRIENGFGTKYKGLYIYDWKVLVPPALSVAWVYKG